MNVQPIYNSKMFKKGLELAANNGALFTSAASLVFATTVRPIAIMSAPKTDKENKKYACIKSISSSAAGFLLMFGVSKPVSNAIKKIDKNPNKYLKPSTIKNLKAGEKSLLKSKRYTFATQLFTLGLGAILAIPKSIMTCELIPPVMSKVFPKKQNERNKNISFTGSLSKTIGKVIDTKPIQKMAEKFHNTNFEKHTICITDIIGTLAFADQTQKSKKIEQNRKRALIYNSLISTGLCIGGTYAIDKLLQKPSKKFIENFKQANKNSPKLEKYIEGIRIVKPALIMGVLYYMFIPLLSTFLADRLDKKC